MASRLLFPALWPRLAFLLALGMLSSPALAERIAIIGTGQVAGALGPEFAALGHTIVYGSREPDRDEVRELVARTGRTASVTTPAEAVSGADFVVLAVPGTVVRSVLGALGNLEGTIIIDPTNPLGRDDDGRFFLTGETSNGELVQSLAGGARVVKAFNTLTWPAMIDPAATGGPVSVPLAGDDEQAKRRVAELVAGLDLEPIDVGPIEAAGPLEQMALLLVNSGVVEGRPFEYHLRRQ